MATVFEPFAVNRTSGTAPRNGTTTHTINFGFTSQPGALVVVLAFGGVTNAAPADWNERLQPVSSGEMSVFTKTSTTGDSSITLTHNGSNYAVAWMAYEFAPGSTYVSGVGSNTASDTFPALTGLSGAPLVVFAARGIVVASSTTTAFTSWQPPFVEDRDETFPGSPTDGFYITAAHAINVTDTSVTPSALVTPSATFVNTDREQVVFAIDAQPSKVKLQPTGENGNYIGQTYLGGGYGVYGAAPTLTAVTPTTVSTSWNVRSVSATTQPTTWDVRSAVASTQNNAWDVRTSASSTQSNTWNVRTSTISSQATSWDVAVKAANPKLETLTDDFSASSLNRTKWDASAASTTITNGRAQITLASAYNALGTNTKYDFSNSYLYAKVTPHQSDGSGTKQSIMQIKIDANNQFLFLRQGTGQLTAQRMIGGVYTDFSITYDATQHAWWRIRDTSSTVYWETSPNGTSWTTVTSYARTVDVTSTQVFFVGGYYGTETEEPIYVDNVNIASALSEVVSSVSSNWGVRARVQTTGHALTGYYKAPQQVDNFVAQYPELQVIADQPQGVWLLSEIYPNPTAKGQDLRTAASGQRLIVVTYSIPGRDNGNYSSGGLHSPAEYATWIDQLATGIATAPVDYILEPDAIPLATSLTETQRQERFTMLRSAAARLLQNANARVYLDVGHSGWMTPAQVQDYVSQVNAPGTGFSLNVSNYRPNSEAIPWANQVSSLTGGKRYIIDTSRNGVGTATDFCNPPGQGLGTKPTLVTGQPNADAFMWIKSPGESDGTCNGGPSAGTFWVAGAQSLVRYADFGAANPLSNTWNTRAVATSSTSNTWDVRSATVKPTATSWDVRTVVSAANSNTWDVRSTATTSTSNTWDVRAAVVNTNANAWNVYNAASSSTSTTWSVRTAVQNTTANSWDVRATANSSNSSTWNVFTSVSTPTSTTWDVRTSVINSSNQIWDVRTGSSSSLSTTWDARAVVSQNNVNSWDVRTSSATMSSTNWDVRVSATQIVVTSWDVRSTVASSNNNTWNVRTTSLTPTTTTWDVRSSVETPTTTIWGVRNASNTPVITTWDVRTSVNTPRSTTWDVAAPTQPVTTYDNGAENGTNNTQVNTDNGAIGGTAFDSVIGNVTYSNARFFQDNASFKFTPSGAAVNAVRWNMPSVTKFAFRSYMYLPSGDSAPISNFRIYKADGTLLFRTTTLPSGATYMYGAQEDERFVGNISTDQWVRFEIQLNEVTGYYNIAYYAGNGTTPIASLTNTEAGYLGTSPFDYVVVGKADTNNFSLPFWIDNLSLDTNTTNPIGTRSAVVRSGRSAVAPTTVDTYWNVRAVVVKETTTPWDVRTTASTTTSTTWSIRSTVNASTNQNAWDVRTAATTSVTTSWSVFTRTDSTKQTAWDVRTAVVASNNSSWNAFATTTTNAAISWTVLARVTSSNNTAWDVYFGQNLTPLVVTTGTSWDVRTSSTSTAPTSWTVLATLIGMQITSWTVRQRTTATQDTSWDALTSATANSTTQWDVRSALTKPSATSWAVYTYVDKINSQLWNTRQLTVSELSTLWRLGGGLLVIKAKGSLSGTQIQAKLATSSNTGRIEVTETNAALSTSSAAASRGDTHTGVTAYPYEIIGE